MTALVAMLGARRDYAVPRILHRAGMLGQLYTDICGIKGWPNLLRAIPSVCRPAGLRRLLGRVPHGIPANRISAFSGFGWEYVRRCAAARSRSEVTASHLWAGSEFCNLILKSGFGRTTTVYGFDSASLELLLAARAVGIRTVVEQTIAPCTVHDRLLQEEHDGFPGWEPPPADDLFREEVGAREKAEWEAADLIMCGSEFVRNGIAASGGPVERCEVVPYGLDLEIALLQRRPPRGPLRVLTVGAIGLRKGSPYVLAVARRLRNRAVFRMVGAATATPEVVAELRHHVEVVGPVPRSDILKHYQWADVFLLPSLCEGSAVATYEALAAGLPVVCTPNTGSLVRNGIEGYIVPLRDVNAIAEHLTQLASQPDLLISMQVAAREHARLFSLDEYGRRLLSCLGASHGLKAGAPTAMEPVLTGAARQTSIES